MKLVDLTLPSPEENLAFDEALLDESEEGNDEEYLRFWEPKEYFVVVGSSNRVQQEVNVEACRAEQVPILRRHSGGGAVLQGPGCLNFCLILKMQGSLSTITGTNTTVLSYHRQALEPLVLKPIERKGFTDLTIGNMKFSGNSQRRRLRYLMFHGTILLHLELDRVGRYLRFPSKQPEYRRNRSHGEFIMSLNIPAQAIKQAIGNVWSATKRLTVIPSGRIDTLLKERYGLEEWSWRM